MSPPTASVVIPVLGRPELLRRALASVEAQSLADFECIVVDDGSDEPLEPVVRAFGSRFTCVRLERNVGVAAARLAGYAHVTSPVVVKLDSDDELVPHAIERAVDVLAAHPRAAAAIGVAEANGGARMHVRGGMRIVEPDEYVRRLPPPFDVVDVFRSSVVHEWRATLPHFFKEEFAFKLALGVAHPVLYVGETWGAYNPDAPTRLSRSFDDPRWLEDVHLFVAHFRPLLGTQRCAPLDQHLVHRRYLLRRRGHAAEARLVEEWLRERRVGPARQARILLRTRYRDRRSYTV